MIPRMRTVQFCPDYKMKVSFDDGREVVYDVGEDILAIPQFAELKTLTGLFESGQLDESRTCISWNETIDLPSDTIYEYGVDTVSSTND